MRVSTYTVDKRRWLDGPWMREPDRLELDFHGLPCLVVRARRLGFLSGYVGVRRGPFYGVTPSMIESEGLHLRVHGGITFAQRTEWPISHSGASESTWWLGFDCARNGDLCPGDVCAFVTAPFPQEYRDVGFVTLQLERLASQLVADPVSLSQVISQRQPTWGNW